MIDRRCEKLTVNLKIQNRESIGEMLPPAGELKVEPATDITPTLMNQIWNSVSYFLGVKVTFFCETANFYASLSNKITQANLLTQKKSNVKTVTELKCHVVHKCNRHAY